MIIMNMINMYNFQINSYGEKYDEAKLIASLQEVTTSLQKVAKQTERLCQILSNRKSNHVIM